MRVLPSLVKFSLSTWALALVGGCGDYYGVEEYAGGSPSISGNAPPNVSVELTGNTCPGLDFTIVAPTSLTVGQPALLFAKGTDPQGRNLAYAWESSAGRIADPSAPWTTLTCVERGSANVFVTVTNGTCSAFSSPVTVDCQ